MAGDAKWASVSNLFHFNGNGNDTGPSPAVLAAAGTGTAASLSSAQSPFGGTSMLVQGTSAMTSGGFYRFADSTRTQFGAGDFTIEAFIYPTSSIAFALISNRAQTANGWSLEWNQLRAMLNGSYSDTKVTWAAPSLNAWHHYALVRSGGTLMVFVDGALMGSLAVTGNWPDANTGFIAIGSGSSAASEDVAINGYIGEVRITKGVARYTAAFTRPAAPFPDGMGQVSGTVKDSAGSAAVRAVRAYQRMSGALIADCFTGGYDPLYPYTALLLNGNAVADKSVNPKPMTLMGYAAISTAQKGFAGTSFAVSAAGDRVQTPSHADFLFGTGDFTIECFAYLTAMPATGNLSQLVGMGRYGTDNLWQIYVNPNGTVAFFNAVSATFNSTIALALGGWYHIAACRTGGTTRLYINGVASGSMADAYNYATYASPLTVGGDSTGNVKAQTTGYLAGVRVTKGVARYTAAFTPPTERFPMRASGNVGEYSFYTPTLDELAVIAFDDDAGIDEFDLMLRTIPA